MSGAENNNSLTSWLTDPSLLVRSGKVFLQAMKGNFSIHTNKNVEELRIEGSITWRVPWWKKENTKCIHAPASKMFQNA